MRTISKKTKEMTQKVVKYYNMGLNYREIGSILGISSEYVGMLLRREGVPRRRTSPKRCNLTEEKINQAKAMYEAGVCVSHVATYLNCSHSYALVLLKSSGAVLREHKRTRASRWNPLGVTGINPALIGCPEELDKRKKILVADEERMRELRANGLTLKEIGSIFGVTQTTVRYHVDEAARLDLIRRCRERLQGRVLTPEQKENAKKNNLELMAKKAKLSLDTINEELKEFCQEQLNK